MMKISHPKNKKELQAFLGIINYMKFCPRIEDTCKALRQLTSVTTEWTWNTDYQKVFDKVKSIIKADACMKCYEETKPLYLETDTFRAGLRASLLQTRNDTN